MPLVEAIREHRYAGKLRQIGEQFHAEDKLLLESGFVKIAGEPAPGVYHTAALQPEPVVEAADEPEADSEPEEDGGRRKYKRRDMTAE